MGLTGLQILVESSKGSLALVLFILTFILTQKPCTFYLCLITALKNSDVANLFSDS